jgi:hypothetical protein
MAELKKKEESLRLTEGEKVYVPAVYFNFDRELIEVFNVFQDDGSRGILLVDKTGAIVLRVREIVFKDLELAKQAYLNWLQLMHDKLAESWKPAEEPAQTTEDK